MRCAMWVLSGFSIKGSPVLPYLNPQRTCHTISVQKWIPTAARKPYFRKKYAAKTETTPLRRISSVMTAGGISLIVLRLRRNMNEGI